MSPEKSQVRKEERETPEISDRMQKILSGENERMGYEQFPNEKPLYNVIGSLLIIVVLLSFFVCVGTTMFHILGGIK